jgi:hypothetical protein
MPGMCLVVVAVAGMLVVGGGSAMAMVEEAAMEAAEKAGNGPGGWRLCSVFHFSPILFLTVAATEGQGDVAVSSREAHSRRAVLIAFVNVLSLALALASLFLLSLLPFPLLLLFPSPSLLPPP